MCHKIVIISISLESSAYLQLNRQTNNDNTYYFRRKKMKSHKRTAGNTDSFSSKRMTYYKTA